MPRVGRYVFLETINPGFKKKKKSRAFRKILDAS